MKKYVLLLFLFLEFYLIFNSNIVITEFKKTLNIIMYNLMPTMFFSIFLTNVLIKLNIDKYFPNFLSNILKLSKKDTSIFIFSLISGYPNNSKMLINSNNLNNLINYTNFVSPFFMFSTINNIYIKNIKISLLIYSSHVISNIIILFILKKEYKNNNNLIKKNEESILNTYYTSLKDTTISLSLIFSNILFFSIIISFIKDILPFNNLINSIIIGLFEFSSGVYEISLLPITIFLKGLLITIIITFSSISMHMQIINFNRKIKYIKYLIFRIFNVLLAIIIYLILYFLTYKI